MNLDELDEFSDLLCYFIKYKYATKITHLDLSGIRSLIGDELIKVLEDLSNP